jgi:hypothetical protein
MPDLDPHAHTPGPSFEVELPGGGVLHLQTQDEVDLWENSRERYIQSYGLNEQNDLLLLGAVLSQQLAMFRAQQRMNGMEAEFDSSGLPTGRYVKSQNLKASDVTAAQNIITKAAAEIRELEKALGIDKKTREQGGQETVRGYVATLKAAAREYGLHVSERMKRYEGVCMEARWKLRLLRNGDAEDRAYHHLTPDTLLEWLERELAELEQFDQQFGRHYAKAYLGRVR